jgi:hypothetical protein
MSIMIRSGFSAIAVSTASLPFFAPIAAKSIKSICKRIALRKSGLSSTIRIFFVEPEFHLQRLYRGRKKLVYIKVLDELCRKADNKFAVK